MNRLATFARIAGIVTVSMFVVLVTRTPSTLHVPTAEAATNAPAAPESTYLPAQYVGEEKAAQASELPARSFESCLVEVGWRREAESNRPSRICNPVHNRFAIAPLNAF